MTVSREEFNGLGKRVDEIQLLRPIVERNERDIQKIFESISQIPEQNQKLLNKIIFLMLIPIGLSVWKLAGG